MELTDEKREELKKMLAEAQEKVDKAKSDEEAGEALQKISNQYEALRDERFLVLFKKAKKIIDQSMQQMEQRSKDAQEEVKNAIKEWHRKINPSKDKSSEGTTRTTKPRAEFKNPNTGEIWGSRGKDTPNWIKLKQAKKSWITNWDKLDKKARQAALNHCSDKDEHKDGQ